MPDFLNLLRYLLNEESQLKPIRSSLGDACIHACMNFKQEINTIRDRTAVGLKNPFLPFCLFLSPPPLLLVQLLSTNLKSC